MKDEWKPAGKFRGKIHILNLQNLFSYKNQPTDLLETSMVHASICTPYRFQFNWLNIVDLIEAIKTEKNRQN